MPIPFLTRLARAKNAGFDTNEPLYHGSSSSSPFSEFDPGRAGLVYFSEDPGYSESYATGGLPVAEYYLKKGKQFDSVGNPKHKQKLIKMFNDKGGWELNAEMQGYDSAKDYFADSGQVGRKNFDYDARYDEDWEILDNLDTDVLADLQAEGFDSFRFQERSPSQEFPKGVVAQAVAEPSRVRSVNAEFDPAKTESGNLLASAAPVATGLLGAAALQPEDAEAKFFTSTQNLLRLGFLTPDSAMNPSAVKGANTKYDKAMRESRAFRARETLRSDIENQTQTLDIGERQIIDPESLLGKVGVPVTGDTSVTGRNLQTIGGIELDNPVMVEGGANFPLRYQDQNFGWASMQSAADKKQKNFRTAQEQTGGMDPVGIFSAMSREAINFSTPVAEALYSQATKLPLAKKDIEEFDRYLRKGPKGTKAKKQKGIKNWVGLQHPDALDQLLGQGDYPRDGSGEIRKQFVEAMELAAFRDRGFPVKEDVYAEAIQSELQGATPGDAGFSIFDALPEVKTTQPNVHQSYDTVIPGTYRGGLEQNIPSRVMFPQIYETLDQVRDKSGNPITEQQKLGSLMMRNDLYEPLNEKWVEGVSKYIKENPKKATTAGLLAAGNANAAQETEPTAQEKFQGILDAAANAGQALTAPAADAPFTAIDALKFGLSDSFPFVTGFTNTPEEVRARQAERFAQMDFQPGALGQQYTQNAQRALGNSPILNALGNVYSNSRILQTPERAITQFADLLPDRGRLVGGSILSALGL